jgi:hypothetical protein
MKSLKFAVILLAAIVGTGLNSSAQQQPAAGAGTGTPVQQPTPQFERQRPMRAANMAGKLGVVQEAAGDHFVIKTSAGEIFRINITEHTRIVGGPGHIRTPEPAPEGGSGRAPLGGMAPGTIPATDIHVGDYVTSVGELDSSSANTINASMIAKLDEERVKELKAREADFGKTYLTGKIEKIEGTKITINGLIDGKSHTIIVDESTSFTLRREAATLADYKAGDMIRADGSGSPESDFHATKISTLGGRMLGGPTGAPGGQRQWQGGQPRQGAPTGTPQSAPTTPQSAPAQPAPMTTPVPAPQQ